MLTSQLLIIALTTVTAASAWGIKDDVLISMCRANCLHHLPAASDACTSCWETCKKVHQNRHRHGYLCETTTYHPGQSLACDYLRSHTTEDAVYTEQQTLSAQLLIKDEHTMIAEWSRPETAAADVVYLVLWTDDNNLWWNHRTDTTHLHYIIEGPHFLYINLLHRILAVTHEGVMAEANLPYPNGYDRPVIAEGMAMDPEATPPVLSSTTEKATTTTASPATETTTTAAEISTPEARAPFQLPEVSDLHPLTVVFVSASVSLAAATLGALIALACSLAKKQTAPALHFV